MEMFMHIELTPVKSVSIAAVGYEPEVETLVVKFTNGSFYVYGHVPPEAVSEFFKEGVSAGRHFFNNVKGKYECVRVS